jgi:DNA-binding NarL/FixJ family response regulator
MTTAEIGPHLGSHTECENQARRALGDAAFEAAYDEGAALDIDEAIAFALGENGGPRSTASAPAEVAAEPTSPLTARERQVAELVAEGLTNRDIAARLMIGRRTVDSYVERILTKLNFGSRAQVAAWVAHRSSA